MTPPRESAVTRPFVVRRETVTTEDLSVSFGRAGWRAVEGAAEASPSAVPRPSRDGDSFQSSDHAVVGRMSGTTTSNTLRIGSRCD